MSTLSANTTTIGTAWNQTSYDPEYYQSIRVTTPEWIVAECMSVIVTSFAVYLVCALTYYELTKRGIVRRRSEGSDYSQKDYESASRTSHSPTKTPMQSESPKTKGGLVSRNRRSKPSHEEKYESWLRLLNLNAAFFAMSKCFTLQIDLISGTYSSSICTGYAFATIMCNGTSFLSVYLLLWLRQWAVHSHHALQHLPVKKLRLISWILLGAILILFVSLCVLFFVTIRVVNGPRGCVFADEGTISQGVRSGSGIAFTGIFQPALFCLMCYPLMQHTMNRRKAFGIGGSSRKKIRKPLDVGEEKIYKIIRRLIISVVLVTISDVGGVIGAFMLETYPVLYIGLVYDINITFGAYVITWSFTNWRQRILPFHPKRKRTATRGSNDVRQLA